MMTTIKRFLIAAGTLAVLMTGIGATAQEAAIRKNLAERLPQLSRAESDPTDPAWVLLEQAAWMVAARLTY